MDSSFSSTDWDWEDLAKEPRRFAVCALGYLSILRSFSLDANFQMVNVGKLDLEGTKCVTESRFAERKR